MNQKKPGIRCRIGLHPWGVWEHDMELKITSRRYGIYGASQPATRQRRTCSVCGKLQFRVETTL